MFHLIHERVVRELAADRSRLGSEDRLRVERAHKRQVERVRASLELLPRNRPGLTREA
jgi:hypothetical protein